MDHWAAYHTDDDEPLKKESCSGDATKQQEAALKRTSADCSKTDRAGAAAVTNAPGDPSWWRLVPDPGNARPLPRTDPQKQHCGFAPELEEGELKPAEDDDSFQDPRLPPGVIDISEELRWRHRERQRQSKWAKNVLARSGWLSAGPMQIAATSHRPGMPPARKPRGMVRGRPMGRPPMLG